jgi:hypothetical protein
MMVPKKSLFLAGAALVCLGAVPGAQKGGKAMYRRVTQPLKPVTLDLETGTLTRGPRVFKSNHATEVSIFNGDRAGFVGVDTGPGAPNGPCEWIDPANKSIGGRAGGATGLLDSFVFAYCSSALDPNSGGPGGAVCIGFRTGYTYGTVTGAGPSGTDVGTFSFTGLPANTNCSSFFGGFSCFLITITFGNTPLCFGGDGVGAAESNVSWSWQFKDLGTDGVLAKTFPFLGCVASCSNGPGTQAGSGLFDGQGMENRIDQYCPSGSLLASFTFGSVNMTNQGSAGFTSIDMVVQEASISTAAITVVNAAPNNQGKTASMALGAPGAALGLTANFAIGCAQATSNGLTIFRLGFGGLTPALPSKWGDILVPISAGTGITIVGPSHGQGILVFPAPIPKNFNFANTPFGFQGFCGDSPVGFTSQGIGSNVQLLPLQ